MGVPASVVLWCAVVSGLMRLWVDVSPYRCVRSAGCGASASGITGHPAHSVVGSLSCRDFRRPPLSLLYSSRLSFDFLSPVSIVSRSVSCLSLVFVLSFYRPVRRNSTLPGIQD